MGHNPSRESLDIHQLQIQRLCNAIEDPLSLAQNHRMNIQKVFVYKSRRYQVPDKSGAPNRTDRFPRLGFEFSYPFGKITIENPRLYPGSRGGRLLCIGRRLDALKSLLGKD